IAQHFNRTSFTPSVDGRKSGVSAAAGPRGYALACVAVAAAFILRLAFDSLWGDRLAYVWFFLAVLVTVRFAAVGPQFFALVAGALIGNWFFVEPRGSLAIAGSVDQINTGIYLAVSGLVLLFSARARGIVKQELAARDRIAGILECTTDAVCTVNREWKVTYFNQRASQMAELEVSEVLGCGFWQLWPQLIGTRFEKEYRRVMERGETVHFEEFYSARNRWIEVHACPYGDGLAIFFRDVSDRKREEASRAQMAAIVESSDDAIVGQSEDGLIVSWNAAAERLYGYPASEALGRSFGMLFPIERSHELVPMLERVCKGERVNHFETTQRTKEGAAVEVSLTISPVQTMNGKIIGVSITARDVTDRKQQEAERERLLKELQVAMAEVKTLSGLLPICAQCKKIRDDRGYWNQIESFIGARSNAKFSHGICPDCIVRLYPSFESKVKV
ncbi:MAG: PAS domain-containing protein, partial [Limisphaerales bacterium]